MEIKENNTCKICKGEKFLNGEKCFACDGTGLEMCFDSSLFDNLKKLVTYKISYNITNQIEKDGSIEYLPIPKITLIDTKNIYPQEKLDLYHDILQNQIIIEYSDKISVGAKNTSDCIKNTDFVNLYKTKELRDEILKVFDPFQYIFNAFFG